MAERQTRGTGLKGALMAVVFVGVCFLPAAIGGLLGGSVPSDWYRSLRKPAFAPPAWVFGPVWTALYVCMGMAAWLIWRRRGMRGGAAPLLLFAAQLALNAAWTPLFFGLRSPALAFADIALLLVMIVMTTARFFPISRAAGWLMAPYLGWTTFAAVLNFALWRMNV